MTCIRETKGRFECRCMVHYKYVLIGYFKNITEAKIAYNDYIIKNNLNRKLMPIH